nr:MAG TPA: hypothetical protein [Caudoviricetes sp.]
MSDILKEYDKEADYLSIVIYSKDNYFFYN